VFTHPEDKLKRFHAISYRRGAFLALAIATAIVPATPAVATVSAVATASQKPVAAAAEFDGNVWAVQSANGATYLGGDFTHAFYAGQTVERSHLAAVDTKTGKLLPWNPNADDRVNAIAVDPASGSVYVGGHFHHVGGLKRDKLAQINPITGAVGPISHKLTGHIDALAIGNGRLYAGGTTIKIDNIPRGYAEAFSLATGALDSTWTPVTNGDIRAIVVDSDLTHRIYLGGTFGIVDGVKGTAFLAAVNPTTGAYDPTFAPHTPFLVRALAVGAGKVYAAVDGPGGLAVAYQQNGDVKWLYQFDGDPQALAYMRGVLYVGGHFDGACPHGSVTNLRCPGHHLPRVKLAAFGVEDGALLPWNPQAAGINGIFGMTADKALGIMSVGGQFDLMGGKRVRRFAEFFQY
jgi:dipeptidyl aminopeptidase/acylaminoacyl peptidase